MSIEVWRENTRFWTHLIFYVLIRITSRDFRGAWQRANVTAGITEILARGFFLHCADSAVAWARPVMCWKATASWTSGLDGQTRATCTAGAKTKQRWCWWAWALPAGKWAVYHLDRRWNPQVYTVCVRLKSCNFQIGDYNANFCAYRFMRMYVVPKMAFPLRF